MGVLILNGVYDLDLINNHKSPAIRWAVDFRGRSPQFITFAQFKQVAHSLHADDKMMLTFENESAATIFSFLDIIKKENLRPQWCLQFRDKLEPSYYQQFDFNFSWVFNAEANWREIIELPKLESLILPVDQASHLDDVFWDRIEARGLEVYLHFNSFEEFFRFKNLNKDLSISLDLTSEIELSYRKPNHTLVSSYLRSVEEKRSRGEVDESFARQ